MNTPVKLFHPGRLKRVVARATACGVLLVLPACRMPTLQVADPAPDLPATFNGATSGTNLAAPAAGMPVGPAVSSTASTAAGTTILANGAVKIIPPAAAANDTTTVAAKTPIVQAGGTADGAINGATLIPTTEVPTAALAAPAATAAAATGPDTSGQLRFDEFYNDPVLVGLVQQALAGNRELKIQEQELRVAANEVLARRGAYLPFVTVGVDQGLERTSRYTRNGAVEDQLLLPPRYRTFPDPLPNTRVGLNVLWELDIWRSLRNARDAAAQRYIAAAERRNNTVTRLIADVAENYYGLMALDKRMDNLDQTIKLQEQSYQIAKAKFDVGKGTDLSVQRFLAEVRRNQSEKLLIKQEIVETENRINLTLNRFPQAVERSSTTFYDITIHALSAGIPAQLLQNRPDIRQAERELAAAGLDVKVARARFYPRLSLSAGVGYESFNPRYLFNPEAFAANVAGSLVAPLVNKTAIQADYGTANARQLQAVYNYQRVILTAFTEVVNRVSMAENYRQSVDIKKQQLVALEASVTAADRLFQGARAEYIEVLFAQRDLRDARMLLIDTKRQQLTAVVNAYQALGGGGNLLPIPDPTPPRLHAGKK